jgi:hypothetical protein
MTHKWMPVAEKYAKRARHEKICEEKLQRYWFSLDGDQIWKRRRSAGNTC